MKFLFTFLFIAMLASFSYGQTDAKFQLGQKAFQVGDYSGAKEIFSSVIENEDADYYHIAHYMRAYANYYLKSYNEAINDTEKSLKIKDSHPDYNNLMGSAYWLYGRIYSVINKNKKSLKYFKKAVQYIQPSLLYSTIGYKEIQLKKYKDALITLNTAIDLDKSNAFAYNNRALLFLKQSDLENARKDVDRSIKLSETNPYAFKHSAMIYIELNEIEKACIDLYRADELGYKDFGNESDANDVEDLIKKYCKGSNYKFKKL